VETFKTGYSGSGLAVDSLGNVWITNKRGSSERGRLAAQTPGWEGGSVTVLRPDGTEAPFSPVYGKGIAGPWAVSVDGNDFQSDHRVGWDRRVVRLSN